MDNCYFQNIKLVGYHTHTSLAIVLDTSHREHVEHNLHSLYMESKLIDITIRSNEGICIDAHTCVLSALCMYGSLGHMCGAYAFAFPKQNRIQLDINLPAHIIHSVLTFMYTGKCDITENHIEQILSTSIGWNFLPLRDACFRYMNDNLTVSNCMQFHNMASSPLVAFTKHFIWSNFTQLLHTGQFAVLTFEALYGLLEEYQRGDDMVQCEDGKTRCIMQWLEAHPECQNHHLLLDLIHKQSYKTKVKNYIQFLESSRNANKGNCVIL